MNIADALREIYYAATEIPEPFSDLSEEGKEQARALLSRFEELEAKHGAMPHRELLLPMLLSKNGRHDDALVFTEQQYRDAPNWESSVAVANVARRAGNLERAVEMFATASRHDSGDVTCWLEIGDIRLEQERFAEALEAYETALATDAGHQWALPSAFYCRHKMGLEGSWLASLQEVANQEGCTCGMEGCLTAAIGGYGSGDGIARAQYLLRKDQSANA